VGWAHALDTPYQWFKVVASHWGGTRNGAIVHWPKGIAARGEIRTQFTHVIDVAPTVLDAAGLPQPSTVHGVTQHPIEGTSMRYAFDDAHAAERHTTQYFEVMSHQGIYHHGWSASGLHRPYGIGGANIDVSPRPFTEAEWNELYDGASDWTQAVNLADQQPDKLAELRRQFVVEAARHNVLPVDDRSVERFNPELAGRPQLITGTSQMFYPGMRRLSENSVLSIKNKSYTVTAEISIQEGTPLHGAIIAQGGAFGGWSLHATGGRLAFCYNLLGLRRFDVIADAPVPVGTHQVRAEFAYDGGGLGRGGTVTLYVGDQAVASGRVEQTVPMTFSVDETTDVGRETGTVVSSAYDADGSVFTGTLNWVRLDTGTDSHDHLIDPAQRLRVAMARQ
jgi:arylsulfatase